MNKLKNTMFSTFSLSLLYLPLLISAECSCETKLQDHNNTKALRYKLAAISSILIASVLGVSVPILGKKIQYFRPENNIFFLIKAFAGGVILSTGLVHILPDAFESLTSPCLQKSWGDFPLTGLVAMISAMVTMMIDSFANSFYKRSHFSTKALPVNGDEEMRGEHEGHVHVHTHATHGHAHGSGFPSEDSVSALSDLIKHRVMSQVLEFGIIVHSVIIGISLGASQSAKTIKPLGAALTFHQFFEGMGLGGCISQAKYKSRAIAVMVISFSLTTPIGIASGIGISNIYNKNTSKALMVEGVLNSASAGILIYMVLVDLLAADFMNPRMQSNVRLQLGCYLSLVVGAGCMSALAQWA